MLPINPSPLAGEGVGRRLTDEGLRLAVGSKARPRLRRLRDPSSDLLRRPPSPAGGEGSGLWLLILAAVQALAKDGPFKLVIEGDLRPARGARMVTGVSLIRLGQPAR